MPTTTAAPTTTAVPPPTTTTAGPTTTSVPDTGDVLGFDQTEIVIDGELLLVAVADTPELRRQGLRNVSDLGDLSGMLFVWDEDTRSAFTMRNTLIDLDIAFLDADGVVLDTLEMEPCTTLACPSYAIGSPFRAALESPLGSLGLEPGDEVELP